MWRNFVHIDPARLREANEPAELRVAQGGKSNPHPRKAGLGGRLEEVADDRSGNQIGRLTSRIEAHHETDESAIGNSGQCETAITLLEGHAKLVEEQSQIFQWVSADTD